MRRAYALVLVIGACGGGESPDTCARLVDRIEKCDGNKLPMAVLWKTKLYCRVSMSYEPEAGDDPNNLAAITKATLTECAGPQAATCDGLHACFERHRCDFVMTSPTDVPQFQCWQ
jgi:predicted molibdopterin-dependent oxidoreductase YjgC